MVDITKAMAQRWLADVPADKQFWVQDGRSLKNLAELAAALKEMSEETFRYHLNESKNDFLNWVRDVIGDDDLTGNLRQSTSRAQAGKVVASRLTHLKRRVRGR